MENEVFTFLQLLKKIAGEKFCDQRKTDNAAEAGVEILEAIIAASMEKRGSAELLGVEHNSKNASSDSLNSDSKSSSLNSKMGQESVRKYFLLAKSPKFF